MMKLILVCFVFAVQEAWGKSQFCYECSSKSALCRYSVYDGQYLSRIPCASGCFLRTEGTTVYRGCFDGWLRGLVKNDYVGCRVQQYLGEQIEWCFCNSSAEESYDQPCNGASRDALSKMALPVEPDVAQEVQPQLETKHKTVELEPDLKLDSDVKYFIPTVARDEAETEAAFTEETVPSKENLVSYDIQYEDNTNNIVLNDQYPSLNTADKTLKEVDEAAANLDLPPEKLRDIGDEAEGLEICISQPDGTYADPKDCTRYYSCSNSMPYRMSCSQGTVWNDRIKSCTFTMTPSDPCRSPGLYNKLFNKFTQAAQEKLAHYKYGYQNRFETAWSSPND